MRANVNAWDALADVLPPAQREQLAALILERLGEGFGVVEIEVREHQVVIFRAVKSILAKNEN